jgi:hypothetical protein
VLYLQDITERHELLSERSFPTSTRRNHPMETTIDMLLSQICLRHGACGHAINIKDRLIHDSTYFGPIGL